jgi:CIC family chloride channel protein
MVAEVLADGEHDDVSAATAVQRPTAVRVDESLADVLDALDKADATAVPVLDQDNRSIVGWLTHQRVLAALRRGLTAPAGS